MNYEKKYKDALERAREYYAKLSSKQLKEEIEEIFPELAESEDEKIKRVIMNVITRVSYSELDGLIPDTIRIWLDGKIKQGEQKPAWSEEDEYCLDGAIETEMYMLDVVNGIKKFDVGNESIKEECTKELNWLKSLKDRVQPKQEWSEDDESRRKKIIHILSLDGRIKNEELSDINNWLKSLRPQSTWKPSDEMLEALYRAIPKNVMEISEDEMLLDKLYQGLKYGRVLSEN